MPWKPMPPCRIRGCDGRSTGRGLCAMHQAEQQRTRQTATPRPGSTARGYTYQWQQTRARFLAAHPHCERCGQPATDVDHILAMAKGGPTEWSNLQALCHSCHAVKTATVDRGTRPSTPSIPTSAPQFRIRTRDMAVRATSRVIHLVGQPATGKGYLRSALDAMLGLPGYGIDDERMRILRPGQSWPDDDLIAWVALEDAIDANTPCVLETSGVSANDGPLLAGRQVYRVLCMADDETRRHRLEARLHTGYRLADGVSDYVGLMLSRSRCTLHADITYNSAVRGLAATQPVVDAVAAWLTATTEGGAGRISG